MQHLQYPIGHHQYAPPSSQQQVQQWIASLANFPTLFADKANSLSPQQLATAYRPEGWTAQQVIHHVADSHINCLIRLKLALTEASPTIKPYAEELWATQPDYTLPIETPLTIIKAVHVKLAHLFTHLKPAQWACTYVHPQYNKVFNMHQLLSLYEWHGRHHLAHLELIP
jgi:hypothetical protein